MAQNMLIQDHKQTILNLLREGETLLKLIGDEERAQSLSKVRQETEGKASPVIMFYGLYNAGKSTIINALCQNNVAPVGDIPTTTAVQEVPWEGYTLIDTPGIDAHADHTETAEKEISRSDVILFVMDNADTFDNALVYQVIVDILKKGKPLAVVINQKNVDEEDDVNVPVPDQRFMRDIMGKVSFNLEKQGCQSGMKSVGECQNFLGIYPVNAKDAYNAREQSSAADRELVQNASGIVSLKNRLNESIRRSERVYMLQTPLINLRDILGEAMKDYQNASIYGEKQALAENRQAILASRQRLRDRLLADGLRKIEAALEQAKSAAANGQPVGDLSQNLNEELNALLREAADQERAVLEANLNMEAMPGYQPSAEVPAAIETEEPQFKLSSLAPLIPIIINFPPVVIPVVVLLKIVDIIIGLGSKEKRAERAAQRAAAESQEKLAHYYRWLNELKDQEVKIKAVYEKSINDFLEQTFGPKLDEINQSLAEVDHGCANHTKNLRELEQLQLRVGDELVALAVS